MIPDFIEDNLRTYGWGSLMQGMGAVTRYLPIPKPTLLVGEGSVVTMARSIGGFGHKRVLVVTDEILNSLGLLDEMLATLDEVGVSYAIFDQVTPNAPIPVVEEGIQAYHDADCEAIVAFGGGSPMDTAKTIAIAVANNKKPADLVGYFKGLKHAVPIYAVPTTAGTGSEVTVAAVISDPESSLKHVVVDTRSVPAIAALDPNVTVGLPPHITAATGMDALTHAVESYVGKWATSTTEGQSLAAVSMIYKSLETAYNDGKNLKAREQMALASTYAGMAFTRANVGYVHAIAHQLGGLYHTPHGLANAIILPYVLRFLRPNIVDRLADLAIAADLGDASEGQEALADKFLDSVEAMNEAVGIPRTCDDLKEADIPKLRKQALAEAHFNYPVPKYMSAADCDAILYAILPK